MFMALSGDDSEKTTGEPDGRDKHQEGDGPRGGGWVEGVGDFEDGVHGLSFLGGLRDKV